MCDSHYMTVAYVPASLSGPRQYQSNIHEYTQSKAFYTHVMIQYIIVQIMLLGREGGTWLLLIGHN